MRRGYRLNQISVIINIHELPTKILIFGKILALAWPVGVSYVQATVWTFLFYVFSLVHKL